MADDTDIMNELEALEAHCRAPIMDVGRRALWAKTWCEDLGEFPIAAIRLACRTWRQGDSQKFPTPGQLLPLVRNALPKPPVRQGHERPWTWPSEADLAGMTLRERRRQYLIMASETRGKAGPMNADGQYPRPEHVATAKAYLQTAIDIAGQIAKAAQSEAVTHAA